MIRTTVNRRGRVVSITASAIAFLAFVLMPTMASAFQQGDWVLGRWQGGAYWYAGVVAGVSGDSITIQYDDGDRETTPRRNVRHYDWQAGTRVECNWQQAGTWYPGRIESASGAQVRISYDDGDRETTGTGNCRSR